MQGDIFRAVKVSYIRQAGPGFNVATLVASLPVTARERLHLHLPPGQDDENAQFVNYTSRPAHSPLGILFLLLIAVFPRATFHLSSRPPSLRQSPPHAYFLPEETMNAR